MKNMKFSAKIPRNFQQNDKIFKEISIFLRDFYEKIFLKTEKTTKFRIFQH